MSASSYIPVGTSLLAIGTSMLDQKSQAGAITAQQDLLAQDALYTQNMTAQEVKAMDIMLGSILDKSAIQSLKDEATLQAMSSASGLSGNITADVVSEATIARRERDDMASQQAEDKAGQMLSSMVATERELKKQQTLLTNQLMTKEEGILGTLGAGMAGMQGGLNFLNPKQQNEFFGR